MVINYNINTVFFLNVADVADKNKNTNLDRYIRLYKKDFPKEVFFL